MSKRDLNKFYNEIVSSAKEAGNKNYCVPTAISVITEKDFDEINSQMLELGYRTQKSGVKNYNIQKFLKENLKLSIIDITDEVLKLGGQTVKSIQDVCVKGRFLVNVRNHALALVDGKVYDHTENKRNRITRVLSITPREEIELRSINKGVQKKLDQRMLMESELEELNNQILKDVNYSLATVVFEPSGKWVKVLDDRSGNSMLIAKRGPTYHVAIVPSVANGSGTNIRSIFLMNDFKTYLNSEGKESKSYTLFIVEMELERIINAFQSCC